MKSSPRILVTGGAGYIGSHTVLALGEAGYDVLTNDNLSTGHRWAVLAGDFVEGDIGDKELFRKTVQDFAPDAVIHFAALIEVAESVQNPLKYYINNTSYSFEIIDILLNENVRNFAQLAPINPYGASKMMVERGLADTASGSGDLKYVSLRYFNVAGADPGGRIGQAYRNPTHLITRAVKTALGQYDKLQIFGTDYPTPDGTCIRDYIHVADLARAHVLALDAIEKGGTSQILNCGYGHGYSVREVVEAVKAVSGVNFTVQEVGRREGDPPDLVAQASLVRERLGWEPEHDDLEFIVKTALEWEERLKRKV